MRIIGGLAAGRRILLPAKMSGTRPTTGRAREALLNILDNRLVWSEVWVLDLFAGTGIFSYECLSRGAMGAWLVENNPQMLRFIQSQLRLLGLTGAKVFASDVLKFLAQAFSQSFNQGFNLVFADPPYSFQNYELLHRLLFANGFVARGGLCVIEHRAKLKLTHLPYFFMWRKYGDSSFSFFKRDCKMD